MRVAALSLLAAAEVQRRAQALAARFERGDLVMQIALAGNEADLGLPVRSLAATIRQAAFDARHMTTTEPEHRYIRAAKAISSFVANTRNGTCIVLRTELGWYR